MNDAALERSGRFLLAYSTLSEDGRIVALLGLVRLKDLTVRLRVERQNRAESSNNFILFQ